MDWFNSGAHKEWLRLAQRDYHGQRNYPLFNYDEVEVELSANYKRE